MTQHFLVCNYLWMFCEGLYLHTLLVVAFVDEDKAIKWFVLAGWGFPLFPTIAYAVARGLDKEASRLKAVRATLILLPLLGLHYVVTPFRPERDRICLVYEIFSALVTSLQVRWLSSFNMLWTVADILCGGCGLQEFVEAGMWR
ncbi:hypothetical protein HPB50_019931 [Hyalomma asiaticum]|uniref:Uncharacterized protein n=1 Tax=Hyalomma asiaticum TaxID=266040 RepID=A0ACB7T0E1_HYAAI|nr:hypothetical protein HPB50_019931 [Hyalomma asiaticum]